MDQGAARGTVGSERPCTAPVRPAPPGGPLPAAAGARSATPPPLLSEAAAQSRFLQPQAAPQLAAAAAPGGAPAPRRARRAPRRKRQPGRRNRHQRRWCDRAARRAAARGAREVLWSLRRCAAAAAAEAAAAESRAAQARRALAAAQRGCSVIGGALGQSWRRAQGALRRPGGGGGGGGGPECTAALGRAQGRLLALRYFLAWRDNACRGATRRRCGAAASALLAVRDSCARAGAEQHARRWAFSRLQAAALTRARSDLLRENADGQALCSALENQNHQLKADLQALRAALMPDTICKTCLQPFADVRFCPVTGTVHRGPQELAEYDLSRKLSALAREELDKAFEQSVVWGSQCSASDILSRTGTSPTRSPVLRQTAGRSRRPSNFSIGSSTATRSGLLPRTGRVPTIAQVAPGGAADRRRHSEDLGSIAESVIDDSSLHSSPAMGGPAGTLPAGRMGPSAGNHSLPAAVRHGGPQHAAERKSTMPLTPPAPIVPLPEAHGPGSQPRQRHEQDLSTPVGDLRSSFDRRHGAGGPGVSRSPGSISAHLGLTSPGSPSVGVAASPTLDQTRRRRRSSVQTALESYLWGSAPAGTLNMRELLSRISSHDSRPPPAAGRGYESDEDSWAGESPGVGGSGAPAGARRHSRDGAAAAASAGCSEQLGRKDTQPLARQHSGDTPVQSPAAQAAAMQVRSLRQAPETDTAVQNSPASLGAQTASVQGSATRRSARRLSEAASQPGGTTSPRSVGCVRSPSVCSDELSCRAAVLAEACALLGNQQVATPPRTGPAVGVSPRSCSEPVSCSEPEELRRTVPRSPETERLLTNTPEEPGLRGEHFVSAFEGRSPESPMMSTSRTAPASGQDAGALLPAPARRGSSSSRTSGTPQTAVAPSPLTPPGGCPGS
eukprot:TRINITY_DN213_c1_g1_i3.p1 TRINITY_DN213_c1_g1~~TRINITY_DN213_c1_g1_i3.p1  ORF type:complete len:900 (+),score=163.24 TRINITY_DN213_c1_g1_i3:95-2794(+)